MKFSWVPISIALASHLVAAATPASVFEEAHVNVTTYAHDINVFAAGTAPVPSTLQLHADAQAAIQQLELSTVEFQDNGPFSTTDANSLEAIANGIETTFNILCQAILLEILPTATNPDVTALLTKDLSTLSSVFDTALATLETEVPAAVKTQIAAIKASFEAVCPA